MSVFQPPYRDKRTGKRKRSKKWHVEFRDHNGLRRRLSAYRDRRESERLEATINELVGCRCNEALPGPDLVRKIAAMPSALREKLIGWDVVDSSRENAAKPVSDHLDDYEAVLVAGGASAKWSKTVTTRARRVFERAGFKRINEIDRDAVVVAADAVRREGRAEPLSARTHNHTLAACRAFTRWATDARRLDRDPLAGLRGAPAKGERKHERRALSADEVKALLEAAEGGPERWGVSGPERALIYLLALETGLRANEIRTLTPLAFSLDSNPPHVTAKAKHTKNSKVAALILRPGLVAQLRPHLALRLPTAPAFNMPASTHTAEMIREDLSAAGVPYEVDGRFADFHALRHTFITNLARAGVQPKVAQKLARHSSVTLTLDYYTHTYLGDDVAAIAKLPDYSTKPREETA